MNRECVARELVKVAKLVQSGNTVTELRLEIGDKALAKMIAEKVRKPVPEIVPVYRHLGDDGKWYGTFGVPHSVGLTGEKKIVGFAYRDARKGTTYGKMQTSEDALRREWERIQNLNVDEFYRELLKMSPKRLVEQAEFWLKMKA